MNWREWPIGAENEEIGQTLECPVCSSTLRPVEIWHEYTEYTYFGEEKSTIFFSALCLKCRTQYTRYAPKGTITISPDVDTIIELEDRVRTLEETLTRLITYIKTQQRPAITPQIPAQQQEQTQDNAEDFTRRYRHLL